LKVTHVFRGGPAGRAGLAAGDTLVAIDGVKATPDLLAALLERPRSGKPLTFHAFRRDELRTYAVELGAAPVDTAYLSLIADPSAGVKLRRDEWLGSGG
jgi:predicted metalloprotease with PDZ domain